MHDYIESTKAMVATANDFAAVITGVLTALLFLATIAPRLIMKTLQKHAIWSIPVMDLMSTLLFLECFMCSYMTAYAFVRRFSFEQNDAKAFAMYAKSHEDVMAFWLQPLCLITIHIAYAVLYGAKQNLYTLRTWHR